MFFFNDTATTEIYTLSLHDALPIFRLAEAGLELLELAPGVDLDRDILAHMAFRPIIPDDETPYGRGRSEEHTSELQSRQYLVCRLLLAKKNLQSCSPRPVLPCIHPR